MQFRPTVNSWATPGPLLSHTSTAPCPLLACSTLDKYWRNRHLLLAHHLTTLPIILDCSMPTHHLLPNHFYHNDLYSYQSILFYYRIFPIKGPPPNKRPPPNQKKIAFSLNN